MANPYLFYANFIIIKYLSKYTLAGTNWQQ